MLVFDIECRRRFNAEQNVHNLLICSCLTQCGRSICYKNMVSISCNKKKFFGKLVWPQTVPISTAKVIAVIFPQRYNFLLLVSAGNIHRNSLYEGDVWQSFLRQKILYQHIKSNIFPSVLRY